MAKLDKIVEKTPKEILMLNRRGETVRHFPLAYLGQGDTFELRFNEGDLFQVVYILIRDRKGNAK